MKHILVLSMAMPLTLLCGCYSTGLSAREQHSGYARLINSWYQKTPNQTGNRPVSRPMHLAVAQIGEAAPQTSFTEQLGKDPNLVRKVTSIPMPGEMIRNNGYGSTDEKSNPPERLATQVESARNLARELGAEYLLLLGGSIDSYNSRNAWSVLDLTLVGAAVMPSVKVHSEGKAAGALMDAETGRILFLANAELQKTGFAPSFYSDERRNEVNSQLRDELLQKMAADVLARLREYPAQ